MDCIEFLQPKDVGIICNARPHHIKTKDVKLCNQALCATLSHVLATQMHNCSFGEGIFTFPAGLGKEIFKKRD